MTYSRHVAIFVLWDAERRQALMENRTGYAPELGDYWVYPGGKVEDADYRAAHMPQEAAMLREFVEELPGVTPLEWIALSDRIEAENGWTTYPYVVYQWRGTPKETTDRGHALKWMSPNDIVQLPPGPTARTAIARLLQCECEICGALVKQEYMRHIKTYLASFTAEQRMRVQSRYSLVPYLACPTCFLPLASYANGVTDRPRVVLEK